MNIKRKLQRKIGNGMGIPAEIISDIPKITVTGFERLVIENYKSIVQYERDTVRINTVGGLIKIAGGELDIKWVTDEMLEICGKIENISRE